MRPLDLNELPKYCRWINDLRHDEGVVRHKSPEAIQREFGTDKWGGLLERWDAAPSTVDTVREWERASDTEIASWIDDQLVLTTAGEAHAAYTRLIEQALTTSPARHLVEIGCGYGSTLLALLERKTIQFESVTGIEYTNQGVALTQRLADHHNHSISVARGDFVTAGISKHPTPEKADVFTSYAFHYVNAADSETALSNLIALKPNRVIHFEPIPQHYDDASTLGLLQKRYYERNDYNTTLLPALKDLEAAGCIEILEQRPRLFGSNYLLPASLVIWKPTR